MAESTIRDASAPVDMATADPHVLPLADFDVSQPGMFEARRHAAFFERLRCEAPVHYCAQSAFGPYWSVSSYEHIRLVDGDHQRFSSEPSIAIGDGVPEGLSAFIMMDPPRHDVQRKSVTSAMSPQRIHGHEALIRARTRDVLRNLPDEETFDWVPAVSVELTGRMLATLLDFPYEDRANLVRWSDIATSTKAFGGHLNQYEVVDQLLPCLQVFTELWNERAAAPPAGDLISLMAHSPHMNRMSPMEYLGNLMLLIVGGNDTTRNTMSGSIYAMHHFPEQFAKLRAEPSLVPNMVSESIRWQTPLAHMRRTATEDVLLGGQQIRKGDKVVMWYVSGNRDETVFEDAWDYRIDRANVRSHLSFGFGVHRCLGNRLAEMQLRVLWEEILDQFERVEVMGEPQYSHSNMVQGYVSLPVRVVRK